MKSSMKSGIYNRLPQWLAISLIGNKLSQKIMRRMVWGQDVIVRSGVGRGLWFNNNRSNPAYAFGNNELAVQKVFESQLQPGDVVLDVGANVGFFTVLSAHLVGSDGHVFAFEPHEDNVAAIHYNVALNGFKNVTVIEAAVADRSGEGELLVAHYSGGSALSTVATPPPDFKERIVVRILSIDELAAGGIIRRPNMVKIDVEGAELTVLRGMVETIRNDAPVILYEIDDGRKAEFERKSKECADFLVGFGYKIVLLADSYTDIDWYVGHYMATKS